MSAIAAASTAKSRLAMIFPRDLEWTDTEKVFDPEDVYGDAPNPTIL
jgi:hypothetical protein